LQPEPIIHMHTCEEVSDSENGIVYHLTAQLLVSQVAYL